MKNIAIVTGASSGIGRQLVKRLDTLGLNEIWGIALDSEGLEEVKNETQTKFVPIQMDLTNPRSIDEYKLLLEKFNPNISWLINAAGFGKFGSVEEIGTDTALNMIDLNIKALVALSELSIPYMSELGRIVNVSSVGAFQPTPYMNVYAASKTFVLNYSNALNVELKNKNVSVTAVCPFWTKTKFFDRAEQKDAVVTKYIALYESDFVADKIMKAATKRKMTYVIGFVSKLQVMLVKLLPKKLVMWVWKKQQKLDKRYN